jgi:hypothetical protein
VLREQNSYSFVINMINMIRVLYIVIYLATVFASSCTVISEQWTVMDDEVICNCQILYIITTFSFMDWNPPPPQKKTHQ